MYICMYACMHACMCVFMYACIYVCICVYVCVCMCVCVVCECTPLGWKGSVSYTCLELCLKHLGIAGKHLQ